MVDFLPLQAWHPRPDMAGQVASPPYDVVDDDQARSIIDARPHSFLRVVKAEAELGGDGAAAHQQAGRLARRNLERLVNDGLLVRHPQTTFFVYRMSGDGRRQTGLAGLASCRDYQQGLVMRHEQTRADKAAGRVAHIEACGAHTGPVLLACRPGSGLPKLLREHNRGQPLLAVGDEAGVVHELWPLEPEAVPEITAWFAGQQRLLIADGHHRAHAAWQVWSRLAGRDEVLRQRAGGFLAVVLPGEEMLLQGYHRLVRLPAGEQPAVHMAALLERLGPRLERVAPAARPRPGRPLLVWQRQCWRLALPEPGPGGDASDASLLQRLVLEPDFAIADARHDPRLSFLGGPQAPAEIRRRCGKDEGLVGFVLHPPALEQVFTVAAGGGVMPPKSTWFEPKLRSGLLVHRFRE